MYCVHEQVQVILASTGFQGFIVLYEGWLFCGICLTWNTLRLLVTEAIFMHPLVYARHGVIDTPLLFYEATNVEGLNIFLFA